VIKFEGGTKQSFSDFEPGVQSVPQSVSEEVEAPHGAKKSLDRKTKTNTPNSLAFVPQDFSRIFLDPLTLYILYLPVSKELHP
jgi:hypothetical protein